MEKKKFSLSITIEASSFKDVLDIYNKILNMLSKTRSLKVRDSMCIENFNKQGE